MRIELLFAVEIALLFILGLLNSLYSLYGLFKKRPVIIRNIFYLGPVILLYVVMSGYLILDGPYNVFRMNANNLLSILFPLFLIVVMVILIVIIGRQLSGFIILGISDELGEIISRVLEENKIQYQEKLSKIILPELKTQINVAITEWIGSAQIQIVTKGHGDILEKIIRGINKYYDENKEQYNKGSLILFGIMGGLIIILGFLLTILLWDFSY